MFLVVSNFLLGKGFLSVPGSPEVVIAVALWNYTNLSFILSMSN